MMPPRYHFGESHWLEISTDGNSKKYTDVHDTDFNRLKAVEKLLHMGECTADFLIDLFGFYQTRNPLLISMYSM